MFRECAFCASEVRLDPNNECDDRHIVIATMYWPASDTWMVRTGRVAPSDVGEEGLAWCRIWCQWLPETNNNIRAV